MPQRRPSQNLLEISALLWKLGAVMASSDSDSDDDHQRATLASRLAGGGGFTSIGARLVFWIVLVYVLFQIPLAVYGYLTTRRVMLGMIGERAGYLVDLTIERIVEKRRSVEHSAETLAALLGEWKGGRDVAALRGTVRAFVHSNPDMHGSTIAFEPSAFREGEDGIAPYYYRRAGDDDGGGGDDDSPLIFADLAKAEYDYHTTDWYRRPIESGRSSWSAPYFDTGGGEALMTTFSAPFRAQSGGAIRGVVTADLTLDHLEKIASGVVGISGAAGATGIGGATGIEIDARGYCIILSEGGLLLYHPSGSHRDGLTLAELARLHQNPGLEAAARQISNGGQRTGRVMLDQSVITGEEAVLVYEKDPVSGWTIAVVLDRAALLSELNHLTWARAVIALLGFAGLIVVVVLTSRAITRPLKLLAEETEKIARGQLDGDGDGDFQESGSNDEIGVLSRSFAGMRRDLRHNIDELTQATAATQKLESELAVARQIQLAMVPQGGAARVEQDNYALAAQLSPARAVGGDWYDFFKIDPTHLLVAVGDVSDKGVPAALLMSKAVAAIHSAIREARTPAAILKLVNEAFCEDNEECMFATLFCGVIDFESGRLVFSSAGHTAPVWWPTGGNPEFHDHERGLPLGLSPTAHYDDCSVNTRDGDLLLLYSDGVTEAFNPSRVAFGEARLLELLAGLPDNKPADVIDALLQALETHAAGAAQSDDIALLALRVQSIENPQPATTEEMKEMEGQRIQVTVALGQPGEAARARREVAAFVKRGGGGEDAAHDAEMIAAEVLDNICEHATFETAAGRPREVIVTLEIIDGHLLMEFRDRGAAFDPLEDQESEGDGEGDQDGHEFGGHGLHIITSLAASLSYHRGDAGENVLIARLRLRTD